MKKTCVSYFAAICALALLNITSCKSTQQESTISDSSDKNDPIVKMVNSMTLRQKIGQVLLVNFRYWEISDLDSYDKSRIQPYETARGIKDVVGLQKVNDTVLTVIKDYHAGNVILFAENTESVEQTMHFTGILQEAAVQNNKIPLLIGIDQEGGRVNRIRFTPVFPPAKKIGNLHKPQICFKQGQILGKQLKAVGLNTNFAPVCDVDSNPANPVIGDRSYSSDPQKAAVYATQNYLGHKDSGVIACGKHFPGHGDTHTDSHYGLPVVEKKRAALEDCEFIPFRKAIKEGIPMIMTAHIQFPGLDSNLIWADKAQKYIEKPATLSEAILQDILRKDMGFEGVIVTDALDMGAIAAYFTESTAAINALNAGANLLCHPISITSSKDLERLEQFYINIENAVKSGKLSEKKLDDSVTRILRLKKEYGLFDVTYKPYTKKDVLEAKNALSTPDFGKFVNSLK